MRRRSIFERTQQRVAAVVALAQGECGRKSWARRGALRRTLAGLGAFTLLTALAGCAVGPDYIPEPAPVPQTFKELKGWKVATPIDNLDRGEWWTVYRDPKLSFLLRQVEISNQNVAAAAASYEQARALIREAQASLFPTLSASYTATRAYSGPASGGAGAIASAGRLGRYTTTFVPGFTSTWDLDVWGKVRRQIESNASAAQATAADLDNAKLSAQAALAAAYFNLRAADSLHDLLVRYTQEYKKTLKIVRDQFNAGFSVTEGDVATAEAQVFTTEAQAINALIQRAAIRTCHRHTDRPPARGAVDRAAPAQRQHSEDSGHGAFRSARAAS